MPLDIYFHKKNSNTLCLRIDENYSVSELYEEVKKNLESPLESFGSVILTLQTPTPTPAPVVKHKFYKWIYDDTRIIFDEDNLRVVYIQRMNYHKLSIKIVHINRLGDKKFEIKNPWVGTSRIMYNRGIDKDMTTIHCCNNNRVHHLIPMDDLEVPFCTDTADFKKLQILYNITMASGQ